MAQQGIPDGYVRLEGSERKAARGARLLGPADENERLSVTITVRRRPDGAPLPGPDFFHTPPHARPRLSEEEFAKKYGASDADLQRVAEFVRQHGLTVEEAHAARRQVVVSGTVEQMSRAFGVTLGRYEYQRQGRKRGELVTDVHRGREGFVHIPSDLAGIVTGVFGLDNRKLTKRNTGDPSGTTTLTVPHIAQLYGFATNSAAGQTIAILSEDGYQTADIKQYFTSIGQTLPTLTDVTVDASNSGNEDPETTQDICIAASAAPGAAVAIYFTGGGQAGWVNLLGRVAHPKTGDPVCSVLSSSFYLSNGDDTATLTAEGLTVAAVDAISATFQDAAIQGITVCIASGDTGTDSKVGDGNAHVQYPASDPWVLSVGGTTVGNVSGMSFDEYVWNDTTTAMGFIPTGATGGGVSEHFGLPAYQTTAGVPRSLNDHTHVGRGVPDVAANASVNSGYPIPLADAATLGISNPFPGSGTSAAAPLWAGLVAVLNEALGASVGFINPALYQLGSAGFRDIVGAPGPADNGLNGVAGYPAGSGWDACTGWGSPNGEALLNALRAFYNRALYFIVDKSTYGADEVTDVISTGGGLYSDAFWVVLDGFSLHQLGSTTPTLGGAFSAVSGIHIFPDGAGPQPEDPSNLYSPQRIRFGYNIIFDSGSSAAFPPAGSAPNFDVLTATIMLTGSPVSGETLFELVSGADPYFTNIDPLHNNVFYLSQDLRVFSTSNGETPLPGGSTMGSDPYGFIQSLLEFMNGNSTYTTPGADPLNALPGQVGYETGDSSVTPLNAANQQNFNFAIARVRLQDSAGASAADVRVFFRLFVAQSCDTDFQPSTTYKSVLGSTGADNGKPISPLPSGTGLVDPSGQSIQTIPFFATSSSGASDYDPSVSNNNIRTIVIPNGQDRVWAYYGCFLDVYDASNQSKFPGTHHCIVAEVAYDDAPIENQNGVTESPENSDKIAQRNLQITSAGNPSFPLTHRVPQAFDMRPSGPINARAGLLLNYPDELMIDWGNTPAGSVANFFWPQIEAEDVIALAKQVYGAHPFRIADANTVQCTVSEGVTYVPILPDAGKNFAGLLTVELPIRSRVGQEFRLKVRRVSTRRVPGEFIAKLVNAASSSDKRGRQENWRYVTGTFQVTIPVGSDAALLAPEETTLAVLKWRAENMAPASRWYPVLKRYLETVTGRVKGFGGTPENVPPSLTYVPPGTTKPEQGEEHSGRVCEVVYGCFGDLRGFVLETCGCSDGGHSHFFECRETALGELALRACRDRLRLTVIRKHDRICELRLGC